MNKELKILAIIPSGFCFGLQKCTFNFFSRFPNEVKSHFLITEWSDGEFSKTLDHLGIPYTRSWLGMFSRKLDWKNFNMSLQALLKLPKLYFDFFKLNKRYNPDVLFFANHHEIILMYPLLLLTSRKVICHMHDPPPNILFQKISFFFYEKVVDHFITISENVRNRTLLLGSKEERVTTIHNGIIIPNLLNTSRKNDFCKLAHWPEDSYVVGVTGQMSEKKGLLDVVESIKLAYSINPRIRLVIGGRPEIPFKFQLVEKIDQLNLNDIVYFAGWQENVNDFYYNIDVFILASQHEEGFGLVIAEALSNQLPVISTPSGGAIEIIENAVNGFIVEKKNPYEISQKLILLSHNKELGKQLGIQGRMDVTKKFNIDVQTRLFIDKIYSLLN